MYMYYFKACQKYSGYMTGINICVTCLFSECSYKVLSHGGIFSSSVSISEPSVSLFYALVGVFPLK